MPYVLQDFKYIATKNSSCMYEPWIMLFPKRVNPQGATYLWFQANCIKIWSNYCETCKKGAISLLCYLSLAKKCSSFKVLKFALALHLNMPIGCGWTIQNNQPWQCHISAPKWLALLLSWTFFNRQTTKCSELLLLPLDHFPLEQNQTFFYIKIRSSQILPQEVQFMSY